MTTVTPPLVSIPSIDAKLRELHAEIKAYVRGEPFQVSPIDCWHCIDDLLDLRVLVKT